jgi:hypothetical protein
MGYHGVRPPTFRFLPSDKKTARERKKYHHQERERQGNEEKKGAKREGRVGT